LTQATTGGPAGRSRSVQRVALVGAALLLVLAVAALVGARYGLLLLIGLGFGIVLEGLRFGFAGPWRAMIVRREPGGVMAHLLAIGLVAVVAIPLLASHGSELMGARAPVGFAMIGGAFVFGACMQIVMGCGSGTLVNAGSGNPVSFVALPFFALGSFAGSYHLLWWTDLGSLPVIAFDGVQGTVITSAMFLTAMAANPLAAKLAGDMGIEITWGGWALAALVPGLISLIVVPLLIYKLYPPEIKETPGATKFAREKLAEMGKMGSNEWMMLGVFVLLLVLWIFGKQLSLNATTAALIGLGVLLLSGVLNWTDVRREEGAWDTLIWFSALVMMATFLSKLGLIPWFSEWMGTAVGGSGWLVAFLILSLAYFYSHYLFASNTAHVSAMYAAFLAVAVAVGTPPLLAALVLAFFSNLFSSMTHYGTGPAPVLFGAGFVDTGTWWKLGGLISIVNIVIWLGIGGLWWKVLGLW